MSVYIHNSLMEKISAYFHLDKDQNSSVFAKLILPKPNVSHDIKFLKQQNIIVYIYQKTNVAY